MADTSTPQTLYHYTDSNGLMGIIGGKTIWATDARFLNDARELKFGASAMSKAIRTVSDSLPIAEPQDAEIGGRVSIDEDGAELPATRRRALEVVARLLDQIEEDTASIGRIWPGFASVFVTCFSSLGDSLSQWRGYGASGGGYAIGFRTDTMSEFTFEVQSDGTPNALPGEANHDTRAVNVDDPVPIAYGDRHRDRLCELIANTIAEDGAPVVDLYRDTFSQFTGALAVVAMLKDAAFESEQEWRIAAHSSRAWPRLRFRSSGVMGLVPYIPIGFPGNAISTILIGPGYHQDLRTMAAEQLCFENNLRDIKIIPSNIPFRA